MNHAYQHMLALQSRYHLRLKPYDNPPSGDALAPADTTADKLERGEANNVDEGGQVRPEQSNQLSWIFI